LGVKLLSRYDIIDCYDRQMRKDKTGVYKISELIQETRNVMPASGPIAAILYDLTCLNKEHLFRELVARLYLQKPNEKENLIQELLKREVMQSTAIGQGIAIPHPRQHNFRTIGSNIVIAVLKVPLDFHAPDQQPVDIVCLVVADNSIIYLQAIRKLMLQFQEQNLAQKLRARTAPTEIATLFLSKEN